MVMARRVSLNAIVIGVITLAMLQPASAFAAVEENASGMKDKHDGIFVISENAAHSETVDGATFYPLPDDAKNSLIVLPEVAKDVHVLPGKVAKSEETRIRSKITDRAKLSTETTELTPTITPMASTSLTSFWVPIGNGWTGEIRGNTYLMGSAGKTYSWFMDGSSNTTACAQGVGYYQGYNGSSFGLWRAWYDIGCGRSAVVGVPWDNVSAYPTIRARSISWTGGFGQFQ